MSDTNFIVCDVKDNVRALDSYMLKISDGKIDDILLVKYSEKANADMCLDYRLENGAVKEQFVGQKVQDFINAIKEEYKIDAGKLHLEQYPVEESLFKHNKMMENLLTFRGEKSGLKILDECRHHTLTHETAHAQNRIPELLYMLSRNRLQK